MDEKCKRCGKTGHAGGQCKAPFSRSWPGQSAVQIKYRGTGAQIWLEAGLTEDQAERVGAFVAALVAELGAAELAARSEAAKGEG